MADWFKIYENDLDEMRLQWAIGECPEVIGVWVVLLSEACRHKSGTLSGYKEDFELFGISKRINVSVPKVNQGIELLIKINYLKRTDDGSLLIRKWSDKQSEYCQKLTKLQNQSGDNHHTKRTKNRDTVGTVSGQTPESVGQEERRGEENRIEESMSVQAHINGKFVKPSVDDVKARFRDLGVSNFEPEAERFWSYYESNGWKVGRNSMKSWQAACVNWSKNIRTTTKPRESFI